MMMVKKLLQTLSFNWVFNFNLHFFLAENMFFINRVPSLVFGQWGIVSSISCLDLFGLKENILKTLPALDHHWTDKEKKFMEENRKFQILLKSPPSFRLNWVIGKIDFPAQKMIDVTRIPLQDANNLSGILEKIAHAKKIEIDKIWIDN